MKRLRLKADHPAHLILGLVVWSLWFVLLYGGLSVVCELAPPPAKRGIWNWLNATLLGLALIVTGILFMESYVSWRHAPPAGRGEPQARFLGRVAAAVYLFAAMASLAISLPVLVLPPCV